LDACPDVFFIGVVKIFFFLEFEPRLNIKYGFNWAGKIEHFSKVSSFLPTLVRSFNSENRKLSKSQVITRPVRGREQIIPKSYIAFIGKVETEIFRKRAFLYGK